MNIILNYTTLYRPQILQESSGDILEDYWGNPAGQISLLQTILSCYTFRCSASFFAQERAELEAKRKKIREIQKGLVTKFDEYRDLPNEIPQTLVVGTAVTG